MSYRNLVAALIIVALLSLVAAYGCGLGAPPAPAATPAPAAVSTAIPATAHSTTPHPLDIMAIHALYQMVD